MTYPTTLKTIRLLLALTLAATQLTPRECTAQSRKEQAVFCETGASENKDQLKPVPMPPEVLTAVMNSSEGKEAQENHTGLDPAKLLEGAPIRLSNSGTHYFILKSDALPLTGADSSWFWIVQQSGDRATTLLWMGANCVRILPTRTLGYRDIEAHWASAAEKRVEIYKFDGKSYTLRRSESRRQESP